MLWEHVNSHAKGKVGNSHCSPLIYRCNNFIIEGSKVGGFFGFSFPFSLFGKTMLTTILIVCPETCCKRISSIIFPRDQSESDWSVIP